MLTEASRITDVNNILSDLKVEEKFHMDLEKYPPVNFKINKNEIKDLVEKVYSQKIIKWEMFLRKPL